MGEDLGDHGGIEDGGDDRQGAGAVGACCGILAHDFRRLRCANCAHERLVASVAAGAFAWAVAPGAWRRRPPAWSITAEVILDNGPASLIKVFTMD